MAETFKRWYDEDPIVAQCLKKLETLQDSLKRQTANYLMQEIINKPPYVDMLPDDIFNLATGESKRRRWYDFDEVVRIFIELLRHAQPDTRRTIAVTAVAFIEDLTDLPTNSIAIDLNE